MTALEEMFARIKEGEEPIPDKVICAWREPAQGTRTTLVELIIPYRTLEGVRGIEGRQYGTVPCDPATVPSLWLSYSADLESAMTYENATYLAAAFIRSQPTAQACKGWRITFEKVVTKAFEIGTPDGDRAFRNALYVQAEFTPPPLNSTYGESSPSKLP